MSEYVVSKKTLEKLKKQQIELAKKVVIKDFDLTAISTIAGVDVSYVDDNALGVVVVLDKNLQIIEVVYQTEKAYFPYIPGFLAFREAPVIIYCFEKLKMKGLSPDIAVFDGQGIAHPRKIGLASHVGVLLNIPTIGVAKHNLYGHCEKPSYVGQATKMIGDDGTLIGYCYLSKSNTRPIYISPGHLTDPDSALEFVKSTITIYKLPEPVRLAHLYTQKVKLEIKF
jgi:deoxyribonuclease V